MRQEFLRPTFLWTENHQTGLSVYVGIVRHPKSSLLLQRLIRREPGSLLMEILRLGTELHIPLQMVEFLQGVYSIVSRQTFSLEYL